MGMTIDEIIQGVEVIKAQAEWEYPLDWQIVLDDAIDIMRKYEKIQETYKRFQKDDDYHPVMAWLDVMAVIDNGNDDN